VAIVGGDLGETTPGRRQRWSVCTIFAGSEVGNSQSLVKEMDAEGVLVDLKELREATPPNRTRGRNKSIARREIEIAVGVDTLDEGDEPWWRPPGSLTSNRRRRRRSGWCVLELRPELASKRRGEREVMCENMGATARRGAGLAPSAK